MNSDILAAVERAAQWISESRYVVAFTGAGISVESGLPSFGSWPGFDPHILDVNYFKANPLNVWEKFVRYFYALYPDALPNNAHYLLKQMEENRWIRGIVTLNIDDLHQKAGSHNVKNVCGSIQQAVCVQCGQKFPVSAIDLTALPPRCADCGAVLKPNILFFGDFVPEPEYKLGMKEMNRARLILIIGTSGTMMPPAVMPMFAKQRKKIPIIEINIQPTIYTSQISDIFIPLPAEQGLKLLLERLET